MDSINNACKFGSDAWLELQAFKTRQLNRREKLNRHKNLHKDFINGISQPPLNASAGSSSPLPNPAASTNYPGPSRCNQQPSSASSSPLIINNHSKLSAKINDLLNGEEKGQSNSFASSASHSNSSTNNSKSTPNESPSTIIDYNTSTASIDPDRSHISLDLVECLLLLKLCDVALRLPIDSKSLQRSISKIRGLESTSRPLIENLLQKFAHQELITIEEPAAATIARRKKQTIGPPNSNNDDDETCIYVTSADHSKLVEFDKSFGSLDNIRALLIESKSDDVGTEECDLSLDNQHSSVPIQAVKASSSNHPTSNLGFTDRDDGSSNVDNSTRHLKDASIQSNPDKSTSSTDKALASHGDSKKKQAGEDLESLLSLSSTRERENKKLGEELLDLLSKPTAKERNLLERFRSADGYQVQEFCPKGTKGECNRNNKGAGPCDKLHFKKIIAKHTEESLGDCSFLNTCFHMDSCKYVHYEVDYDEKTQPNQFKRPHPAAESHNKLRHDAPASVRDNMDQSGPKTSSNNDNNNNSNNNTNKQSLAVMSLSGAASGVSKYTLSPEEKASIEAKNRKRFKTVLYPPQWIQCDLRFFDMSLLGKFSVVMADPPWDIHMELPYGTMSDDEMRKLNIPALQDEGVIFLWVTGRAMELGRECLALWGYERCDEIIWVKTNQLQRIIRTGRTGHWLNHGKEHCLVGVKGSPKDINRGLDCDVIVAEVRATSHKPDEIYGIIERLSPGTRKIELFGRAHNVQPNWITLGNQLNGARLIEPSLQNTFKKLNMPFETADHQS